MLRQSLLYLSESPAARKAVTGTPVSRWMAERFVAGETLDDAIRAARSCNVLGLMASLDYLGESVRTREEAIAATDKAIESVKRIHSEGIVSNVSVKLTQFGLEIDEDFCRENLERLLMRARECGNGHDEIFVRLDMEDSEFTERTVSMVESLFAKGHRNVGTVLQSYLRRTPHDLDRLIAINSRVRLVKGAYMEPEEIAYPDKADVDRMFIQEMERLLREGNYPAIATHDEAIIDATRRYAFEHGIRKDSFEFQMLYGIRRDLQTRLREEGYNVRVYIPYGEQWYPYLMRRMAERPANLLFVTRNVLQESPARALMRPLAIGAGALAGAAVTLLWRTIGNHRR